jgi:hypothetical protein
LLDGANFCFVVRAGSGAACAGQGQAGIYVGNLKPKLVGRLRKQAGLCLGREVRYNQGVASTNDRFSSLSLIKIGTIASSLP